MKVVPIKIEAGITGFESPAAEYQELGLSLDELLIQHPNATFVGVATGDSMIGCGIFDGDILIVDRALEPHQGDVIVANFNGVFTCKIFDKQRGMLISSSPHYPPILVNKGDTFQYEGVVSTSVRLHRARKVLF